MKIVVDGKSMCVDKVTGIVRVHIELLKKLDEIVDPGIVELLIPGDCNCRDEYKNIKIVKYGRSWHVVWRQVFLAFYILKHKAIALCLSNSAPILCPGIVCIHDINAVLNPENYNSSFISRLMRTEWVSKRIICKRAIKIFTPSEFTRKEVLKTFKCGNPDIAVVNFGWQHFIDIIPDFSCNTEYGLDKGSYYFSLGSLAPHKNFQWIIDMARHNQEDIFVIAGAANPQVFGNKYSPEVLTGIKYVGYISDQKAKALIMDCKAFLFPSLYEGFGIPPLEALSVGTEVVASDIPVLREILGNAVHYIDPHNSAINLDTILGRECSQSKNDIINQYSWENAAKQIWNIICEFGNGRNK